MAAPKPTDVKINMTRQTPTGLRMPTIRHMKVLYNNLQFRQYRIVRK